MEAGEHRHGAFACGGRRGPPGRIHDEHPVGQLDQHLAFAVGRRGQGNVRQRGAIRLRKRPREHRNLDGLLAIAGFAVEAGPRLFVASNEEERSDRRRAQPGHNPSLAWKQLYAP